MRYNSQSVATGGCNLYYHSPEAFQIAEFLSEYWGATPKIIDETVRVTRKFLKEHPEYIKTEKPISDQSTPTGGGAYHHSPEAFQIAEFLGDNWGEHRRQVAKSDAPTGAPTG